MSREEESRISSLGRHRGQTGVGVGCILRKTVGKKV